ncbi:MAG: trypsin-like peptidase domain-containing protein [Treponema sp.]|nr:trypsin-like peptidase domain-containing protein [Treponema sp.]
MKTIKTVLLKFGLLLTCLWYANASGMRDYVCIVRSNYSEQNKAFLNSYKTTLENSGYKSFAKYIESYLKGSYGSGFIYTASNGKSYIVTNRHVISSAETATVQFENDDGSTAEYKDLKILGVDEDLDIAVIEMPSSFKKAGLTFRSSKVTDGDDVWTAGFPGLNGEPVWQFGKGSVTNASARIKELVNPDISVLIQHSAQVDGGNSGGPLLIADSKAKGGYSVVGINTWKATKRENTNFAIPAAAVKESADKIISSKGQNKTIAERIKQFNESIANKDETFSNMSKYISNEMVSNCKSNSFTSIVNSASKASSEVIVGTFAVDPIEGVRYALAYYIWNAFRKGENPVDYKTTEPEESGNGYKVMFDITEKKSISSFWTVEQGRWRLTDFDDLISKGASAKPASGFSMTNPYMFTLWGGAGLNDSAKGFIVEGSLSVSNAQIFFSLRNDVPNCKTGFAFGTKFYLPLNFGTFIVQPIGGLGFGFYESKTSSSDSLVEKMKVFVDFGADVIICINSKMGVDISARYSIIDIMGFDKNNYKSFSIGAGLTFGTGQVISLW